MDGNWWGREIDIEGGGVDGYAFGVWGGESDKEMESDWGLGVYR